MQPDEPRPIATDILATPRKLGTLLRRLVDHLDSAVEDSYRQQGLDYRPRYTPIVRALRASGPCSMQALVRHMGVSQSAVSQTLSEMVGRGLVAIRQDSRDGRARVVELTPRAFEMLPHIQRCWDATEAASATLDQELGQSLPELIARAITLLEHRSLGVRIAEARIRLDAEET
jgi:DNA-binding MarR family transcriptional regulator